MDAWIEILGVLELKGDTLSHPLWMRGLKFLYRYQLKNESRRILYGCVD